MSSQDLRMAGDVLVSRRGGICQLFIDGEEFPWYTARQAMVLTIDPDGVSTVTLALLADRVTVLDDGIDAPSERVDAPVRMTGSEAVELITAHREDDRRELVFATERAEKAERDLRWERRQVQLLTGMLIRRQQQLDTAHSAIVQRDRLIATLDPELEAAL